MTKAATEFSTASEDIWLCRALGYPLETRTPNSLIKIHRAWHLLKLLIDSLRTFLI